MGIARATERANQQLSEKVQLGDATIDLSVALSQAIPESLKDDIDLLSLLDEKPGAVATKPKIKLASYLRTASLYP